MNASWKATAHVKGPHLECPGPLPRGISILERAFVGPVQEAWQVLEDLRELESSATCRCKRVMMRITEALVRLVFFTHLEGVAQGAQGFRPRKRMRTLVANQDRACEHCQESQTQHDAPRRGAREELQVLHVWPVGDEQDGERSSQVGFSLAPERYQGQRSRSLRVSEAQHGSRGSKALKELRPCLRKYLD